MHCAARALGCFFNADVGRLLIVLVVVSNKGHVVVQDRRSRVTNNKQNSPPPRIQCSAHIIEPFILCVFSHLPARVRPIYFGFRSAPCFSLECPSMNLRMICVFALPCAESLFREYGIATIVKWKAPINERST